MKKISVFTYFHSNSSEKIVCSLSMLVDNSPIFGLPPYIIQLEKEAPLDLYEFSQEVIINILSLFSGSKNPHIAIDLTIYIKYNPVCFDWKKQFLSSDNKKHEESWKQISYLVKHNSINLNLEADSILNMVK